MSMIPQHTQFSNHRVSTWLDMNLLKLGSVTQSWGMWHGTFPQEAQQGQKKYVIHTHTHTHTHTESQTQTHTESQTHTHTVTNTYTHTHTHTHTVTPTHTWGWRVGGGGRKKVHLVVISKRPVPQHLKEGVMINVLANVIQVVVLSTRTDALLGVGRTHQLGHVTVGVHRAEEDRLELGGDAKNTFRNMQNISLNCVKTTRPFLKTLPQRHKTSAWTGQRYQEHFQKHTNHPFELCEDIKTIFRKTSTRHQLKMGGGTNNILGNTQKSAWTGKSYPQVYRHPQDISLKWVEIPTTFLETRKNQLELEKVTLKYILKATQNNFVKA